MLCHAGLVNRGDNALHMSRMRSCTAIFLGKHCVKDVSHALKRRSVSLPMSGMRGPMLSVLMRDVKHVGFTTRVVSHGNVASHIALGKVALVG